ncbi:MAG TPA: IS21 family transposase, partial [Chloroflexota bacterium]
CTPAAGWEKGQVENQVGFIRERIFVPRLKCKDFEELNRELADRCRLLSAGHSHPEFKERTVAQVYVGERAHLLGVPAPFDAYKETPARVTSTSLVSFDSNRYSVDASAVGRTVMLRAYADRVVCVDAGVVVGEHPRLFGKNQVSYDPWHYLSVLERKPGALRNGAPFKDWDLPQPLTRMRDALLTHADGDRQFVGILSAIRVYGLEAVSGACAEALAMRATSKDVVWNLLARVHDGENRDGQIDACEPSDHLPVLSMAPIADCGRYDALLRGGSYAAR